MTPDPLKFVWNIRLAGEPEGLPLLWLHGFLGSSTDWLPMVEDIFPEYCHILVDLPGHGDSIIFGNAPYAAYLDSLMDQLSQEGFEALVVIGYSMGGRLALHLQQRFPDNFKGMIGLSCAPGIKSPEERQQRQQSDNDLMDSLDLLGFSEFIQRWYAQPLFGSIQGKKNLMGNLMKSRSKNDPSQLRRSINLLGNGVLPSLWGALAEIPIPVLLLSGSEDIKYNRIHQEMIHLLPSGSKKSIPGGHAFHLEKPLETALAIRHFLSDLIEGV